MADRLLLVSVQRDGSAGVQHGELQLRGDQVEAVGEVAVGVLDTLRRRSRLPDSSLWADLVEEGWSNGQLMLVPADD